MFERFSIYVGQIIVYSITILITIFFPTSCKKDSDIEEETKMAESANSPERDAATRESVMPDGGVAAQTMKILGRHLYDICDEKVILRGVNKMVVWVDWSGTPRDGMPSYSEIAKTGANSVRIVWVHGENTTAQEFDRAIANAIDQKLIPMVELHDMTCKWSPEGIQALTDFWTSPEIVAVIKKHQRFLLLNFGNEIGGWNVTDEQFRSEYESAINQLRSAQIKVPIVIDGTKCGTDIDMIQRNAAYLISKDPLHNLMFSVHMWWNENNDERVRNEIAQSVKMELPLVIGEFAHKRGGCQINLPYLTILEESYKNEIGFYPWSWGPRNRDCVEHSMSSDDTFDGLHGWGLEVAVTNQYSIKNTSIRPNSIVNGICNGDDIPNVEAQP